MGDTLRLNELCTDKYPQSWAMLMPSKSLKPGKVLAVECFGQPMALFRTESGKLGLIDRFCPHQGASFACGGVKSETVVCPFHSWEFGVDGGCKKIPDVPKIPPHARVDKLPVREHLGYIWVFNGAAETFELPPVPEFGMPGHHHHYDHVVLDTHALSFLENVTDLQHFRQIHHTPFRHSHAEMLNEGPHLFEFMGTLELGTLEKPLTIRLHATYHGPTLAVTRVSYNGELVVVVIGSAMPLGANKCHLHFVTLTKALTGWKAIFNPIYLWALPWRNFREVHRDYGLALKHMNPSKRRVLVESDWLQQKYRKFWRAHLEAPKARELRVAG